MTKLNGLPILTRITLLFICVIAFSANEPLHAATTVTVTSQGDPSSGGSVTLTINGVSKTTRYGAFSTAQSIASALAAMFSADCNSPALAKANNNGSIIIKPRGTGVISQADISSSSDQGGTAAFNGDTVFTGPPSNTVLYGYNIQASDGSSGYTPDGNILGYSDSVNGNWSMVNGYDALNRLVTALQVPIGRSSQYACWNYDSFGNRVTQATSQSTFGGSPGVDCSARATGALLTNNWVHYDQNNRPTENWSSPNPNSLSPDASGNVGYDGQNTMLYDQDGRLCAVSGPGGMTGYLYDAEGQRVAKGTITSFSCDPIQSNFNMTEEILSTDDGSQSVHFDGQGTWLRNDLYVSGQLIATYANDGKDVHYHLIDWLGVKRLTTASDGTPEMKCESGVFGDSLACSTLANNVNQVTDVNFTGKERDTESGLDYFGARYYGSNMGRFMSPDPSGLYYADLSNPQSLNLYSYAQNNPLKNIDPTGLDCVYLNDAGTDVDRDQNGNVTGIDHNSNQSECNGTGGYWAPGNVAGAGDVHTFSNSDLIGVNSTTNGQSVFSVANCAGCSTTNSNGSLMGTMTQTIGNQSIGDMSFLFSNLAQNPLPRPMDQIGRWPPILSKSEIRSWCAVAVSLRAGGTVPGNTGTASNSPSTLGSGGTDADHTVPVPSRGARYGGQTNQDLVGIPMNGDAAKVDTPVALGALAGSYADCVNQVSAANR